MKTPHALWTGPLATVVLAAAAAAFAQSPDASAPNTPEGVFAAWDADADGVLSRAEFTAGWTRMSQAAVRRGLQAQFARHDRDRSGALDAAEMAQLPLVRQAGPSTPPLARFDANRNGGLEFPEYVALVSALAQEPSRATR